MRIKFGKIIQGLLVVLVFAVLQSCVSIETNMSINSDLTGISESKISIVKNLLQEEQLRKEIEKLGLKNFELKKQESEDGTNDMYNVKMEWKNEEELKKILLFMNTGATMSEFGNIIPSSSNKESEKEENTEKTENETVKIKTKTENKNKKETEVSQNTVDTGSKIFVKEKGTVSVNMGVIKANKLTVKVKGKIDESSAQSGIVAASKDEITFYEGDKAVFKYRSDDYIYPVIIGICIAAALGIAIFTFIKLKNNKNEEAVDDYSVEEIEENDENSENENSEDSMNDGEILETVSEEAASSESPKEESDGDESDSENDEKVFENENNSENTEEKKENEA